MQQRLQKLKTNALFFLELQLLISIVILPMLIAWGLPISIMSILGNLIFAQFLTVFIFFSALLFVSDLLAIPNSFIALCLEWTAQSWHYLLSFGSAYWLVGFPSWVLPISIVCAVVACALYYGKQRTQNTRIIHLTILCLTPYCIYKIGQPRLVDTIVMQGSQKMYIIKTHNRIYAFDCGALGARPSSQSWIEYTLASSMIKNMGATHIDTLFLCKSNSRTPEAVAALVQHIPTKKVITLSHA